MDRSVFKPAAMTIGGFDPGSGAGITADLKTFSSLGIYGVAAVSCLTSQNHTAFGSVREVDPAFFREQIGFLSKGYRIRAAKTGLMTKESAEIAGKWKRENPDVYLISDPVLSATSGYEFFGAGGFQFLKDSLLRHSDLITPNIREASLLTGMDIKGIEDMRKAGKCLLDELSVAVLIKGGHLEGREAIDILFAEGEERVFRHGMIEGINTHGSGCILSAAITAHIARGEGLLRAVTLAKEYITGRMNDPVLLEGTGRVIEPGK